MTIDAVIEHLSNIVDREVNAARVNEAHFDSEELTAIAVACALLVAATPR